MPRKRKKDQAEQETDILLEELEKKIATEYSVALKDVQEKYDKFAEGFAEQEAEKKKLLDDGKITDEDFTKWRQSKLQSGKRYQQLIDTLASDLAKADQKAMSIAYGYMPDAYALNFNYSTYEIEQGTGINTSFTLYNRETVERLIRQNDISLPKRKVDIPLDEQWNRRHINSAILQGVLQGESIPNISKRLRQVTDMDRRAAIRNARTMMTGAQNAGRMDAYERASGMGIKIQKEWMATLDSRTRDSHQKLDGERVDWKKVFSNGLMYPGDPSGDPAEVYNCRCTMVPFYPDYAEGSDRITYQKWAKAKEEPKQKIVQGKDISETWERRSELFDFEIEDVINAQGFDGLPRVVPAEEFDEYVKQANNGEGFIAQRTYSAPNQETLDAYRDQLYSGKWYVDCSTGGAQYGQGMYCAADYEGRLTSGIHEEMRHYKEINADRGNVYAYIETLTLDKTAKITDYNDIYLEKINKQTSLHNNIENNFRNRFIQENELSENEGKWLRLVGKLQRTDEEEKWYNEYWDTLINGAVTENEMTAKDMIELKQYYDAGLKEGIKNSNEYQLLLNMDIGSYAAIKGFDAINAKGHGESGSYTVILNRTKVIFRRDK